MTKFKTFFPYIGYLDNGSKICYDAAEALNQWLTENLNIEIVSWQATEVEKRIYITIQYRELED